MVNEQSFGDILINSVEKFPNKIAFIEGDRAVTYKELLELVIGLQNEIGDQIKENKVTIIHFPNSLEYVISYFAVSMLGGILFPVYWNLTEDEFRHIIDFTDPNLILTNAIGENKVPSECKRYIFDMDTIRKDISKLGTVTNKKHDNEALLLLTSGTTSAPKIVAHSFQNIISNLKMHIESLSLNDKDSVLITLPFPFGYCNTSQFLTHIYLGSKIVIYKDLIHPGKILKSIDENNISVLTVVPTLLKSFELINESILDKYKKNSLKYLCFGGSPISKKTISTIRKVFPQAILVQTYGQTEAGPRISTKIIKEYFVPTNVGRPLKGVKVEIRDSEENKVQQGVEGEIYVWSPSMMMGYFNDPIGTTKVVNGKGYLKTGDIGYFDNDNNIHIKGRKKNIIKFKGIQFQPEEIEDFLKNKFPLSEAMVWGEPDEAYGEIPVAYLVPHTNLKSVLTEDEIKDACRKRFSSEKIPRKVYFVESIEKSLTGKVKRSQM